MSGEPFNGGAQSSGYGVPTVLYRRDSPVHLCVTAHSQVSPAGWDLVVVHGELETFTAAAAADALRGWVDDTEADLIVVDLAGVEFLDGRGVRLLTELRRRAAGRERRLRFRRSSPVCRFLFEVCGVENPDTPTPRRA